MKYEYNGLPQKIVPLTTEQFAILLETLLKIKKQGKNLSHKKFYELYSNIIISSKHLSGFSDWTLYI